MTKRKQTPDVLAAVLGGNALAPEFGGSSSARSASPNPQEETPPNRWVYRIVTFQDYKGWRPRFVDGHEIKDWMNGPVMHEFLEQLGEEGWDLTAASAGERLYGNADHHQLFFKRPRA